MNIQEPHIVIGLRQIELRQQCIDLSVLSSRARAQIIAKTMG
jgi:hypothetical protein